MILFIFLHIFTVSSYLGASLTEPDVENVVYINYIYFLPNVLQYNKKVQIKTSTFASKNINIIYNNSVDVADFTSKHHSMRRCCQATK